MQIMWKCAGVEWWIAQGPIRTVLWHCGPLSVQHNSRLLSQVSQVLRAGYVKAFSRGNIVTRVSFSSSVLFTDLRDAGVFAVTWPVDLPRSGDLTFVLAKGTVITKKIMADAVLEDISTSQTGVSVSINYSFVGGSVA